LDKAAAEAVESVKEKVVHLMETSPATGKVYRRAGGRIHQASARGEPPAVDYGNLVASFYTAKVQPGLYILASDDPKAAWLEWGTPKMAARPAVRPAIAMTRAEFTELLRIAIQEGANE
jgi:hypothetical protein